jgi:signal transduction histidine kinase
MQVLLGLQTNALKFTSSGKVETKVEIIERIEDSFLRISVIDTGIGIAKEDH